MPETALPADRPTLANWRRSPWNREAFRRVDALVPCATIAHDPAATQPLPLAPRSLDDLAIPVGGGQALDVAGFLAATAGDGLVVLHRGAVVLEAWANGLDATQAHALMSVSKSIVGLLAGALHGRGLLDVEAPVATLVPEVAETAWGSVPVRDLLDMRSGVVLDEAAQRRYRAAAGWDPVAPDEAAGGLHDFFATTRAAPAVRGGPFAYVSPNTDLLGWVLERAAGLPFPELASQLLWRPLGATHDALVTLDARCDARTTGGLVATVPDLARVGALVAEGGRGLVPEAWLTDLHAGGDRAAWAAGEFAGGFRGLDMRYRSGWYVAGDGPALLLFAMGIHGQRLFVEPARGLVVALVSSQDGAFDPRAMHLLRKLLAVLRERLPASD